MMREIFTARGESNLGIARLAWISFFVVLSGFLGASAVLLTPPGSTVAAWWPAAGTSAIAIFLARRTWWVAAIAIAIATTLANMAGGRPLTISVVFGVINAIEASIVVLLLARLLPSRVLRSIGDTLKFIVAAAAGSLSIGVFGGLAVWLILGGDPLLTFAEVTPSHFSAIMVILPIVLTRWRDSPKLGIEFAAQVVVLTSTVLVVFWPGHFLPLAFLPLPVLTWAAIRFGLPVVTLEVLAVAVASLVMTFMGGGPFAGAGEGRGVFTTTLLQIYFLSYASALLLFGAAAREREQALRRASSSENILRSGLLGAQIGLVIVAQKEGRAEVLEANAAASMVIVTVKGGNGPTLRLSDSYLTDAIEEMWASSRAEWSGEWDAADGGARLNAFITKTHDGNLSIQIIDVTARHKSELATAAALRQESAAAEVLRSLNKRQDEFVASVSHELRTPISSVIGFTDELEETELDDTQRMYTKVIARNGRRLLALVNDLLTLAALDRGESLTNEQPVAFTRLIADGVEDLSAQAKAARVELAFVEGVNCSAETEHPQEVGQVLTNLIGNAVKFTLEGGLVTVMLTERADDVAITVSDTGRGIPPAELESVLERFVRSSSSAGTTGTGLGLPIVKKLVESMGGSILLDSDGVSGTTVTVTLPRAGHSAFGLRGAETEVAPR